MFVMSMVTSFLSCATIVDSLCNGYEQVHCVVGGDVGYVSAFVYMAHTCIHSH